MSVRQFKRRVASLLLISLVVPLHSQQPSAWKDPSPHSTRFVTVDKNVRLEVLGTRRRMIVRVLIGEVTNR
jgi:hypothetical protein